jgi:hypothetical protein
VVELVATGLTFRAKTPEAARQLKLRLLAASAWRMPLQSALVALLVRLAQMWVAKAATQYFQLSRARVAAVVLLVAAETPVAGMVAPVPEPSQRALA